MIKIGISKIIFLTVLKMEVMCPKDADRMANSVDPDQTSSWSSLIWVCTDCSDLFVPIFRIFMVNQFFR